MVVLSKKKKGHRIPLETLLVQYTCTNPTCKSSGGFQNFEIYMDEKSRIESLPETLECTVCQSPATKGLPYSKKKE